MSGAAALAAELLMKLEQEIGGRPIGAVDDEAPADLLGLGADFGAVARDPRLIVLAPVLGATGRDGASPFRLDEFDAPGVREGLLGGIHDLHDVAERSGGRQPGDGLLDLGERAPQV